MIPVVVPSGTSVSSAVFVPRGERPLLVAVPSVGAGIGAVVLQASVIDSSGPWAPLLVPNGMVVTSGGSAIWSGAGAGFSLPVEFVPAATVRLTLTGSVTGPTSFALVDVARG